MVQVGQLAEGMIKHDNESMTPPHHMDPADDDHSPRVCLYNLITVILTLIIYRTVHDHEKSVVPIQSTKLPSWRLSLRGQSSLLVSSVSKLAIVCS